MADLNKVFLMGRLTFDPELRRTPSGTAVTELRLATSAVVDGPRRRAQGGDALHRRDGLGPPGRELLPVPEEGEPVHVEGSLKMDTWDDKTTGEKRSKIRVQADRVQFLDRSGPRAAGGRAARAWTTRWRPPPRREPGPRRGNAGPTRGPSGGYGEPRAGNGPARSPYPPPRPAGQPALDDERDEDDIPF